MVHWQLMSMIREGLERLTLDPAQGSHPSNFGTWVWYLRDRHFGCVESVKAEKSVLLEFLNLYFFLRNLK
jgi:hypothetical protein